MDPRSPSYEASLLYEAPGASDPALLAEDILKITDHHDLPLRQLRAMDGIFLHFDCRELQLLLAFCGDPLPPEHFLEASRPSASMAGDQVILRQLTRQTAHLTVLVLDHPDAARNGARAPAQVKRDLCWDVTSYLTVQTAPSLVFWSANDTLYTAGEFCRRCDFLAAQMPPLASGDDSRNAHLHVDPVLPPKAAERISAPPCPGSAILCDATGPDAEPPDLDASVDAAARGNVALGLAPPPGGWSAQRAIRSLAMACSGATIGLGGMANLGGFF